MRGNAVPMNEEEKTKAAALLATGMTAHAVAAELKRDPKTIKALIAKPETALAVADFTERFAGKLEATAERILDSVTAADIEKASLRDKAISAGIFFDKTRLARGQSTSNVSVLFQVAEAAENLRRDDPEAYARAEARGAARTVDAEVIDE